MARFIGLMREKKYEQATAYLSEKIEGLKKAGADFAVLSANTPHLLFDQLQERSGIPLISIVEATCSEAKSKGLKKAGLFGTDMTMQASFFPDVFRKQNMEVVVPDEGNRKLINQKLFSEIELGIFKDETRRLLIGIIEKMVREQKIDSLILGCTELPLILTEETYVDIPVLNTTRIHVDSIVKYCRGE
jgi:aspartate racemase